MIIPVTLKSYRPLSDKTFNITFSTQELTAEQLLDLNALLSTFGVMYYRGTETLSKAEIKELDNLDLDIHDEPKSQSQRLKNVLYLNWQKDNKGYQEFKDYYKFETEKIIQHYKNKLD